VRVLVVIFGGLDHQFLARWELPNLRQCEWGPVVVDELWDGRDVASQITAQLITGRTWRDNGVNDRKRQILTYRNQRVRWVEERLLANVAKGRRKRRGVYEAMGWLDVVRREFLKEDLACPSLFEEVPGSRAVYVPAYNPEPSWALDRNILDPRRYPELGVEGALDLRDKNFAWRRKRFMEALDDGPFPLLMGQFQFIDSTQHLYLSYADPPDMAPVEAAYVQMDAFAGEILARAEGRYDRVVFLSDNGAACRRGTRPTHHNRPYYSLSWSEGLDRPNLRDFHDLILKWTALPGPGEDSA
jgi:hypothetical protein